MFPWSDSKLSFAHTHMPQSSSLMNMPLYFTEGSPTSVLSPPTWRACLFCGATSAHHMKGDTPARRDISNRAYAVPRGVLPNTTRALSSPSTGFSTICRPKASHLPFIPLTSSLPLSTMPSMSDDCPIVPAITAVPAEGTEVRTAGLTPVTVSMSPHTACAAVATTSASAASITKGAAPSSCVTRAIPSVRFSSLIVMSSA